MMSTANPVAINMETLRTDSGCTIEKEFIELIYVNPLILLYLTINKVDSCHGFQHVLLT